MRISFVGKGGSGKTTVAALFTQLLSLQKDKNIYAVDADLNVHLANMLGFDDVDDLTALSSDDATSQIKDYLKGENERILSNGHFKKSTPPSRDSNLIHLKDTDNFIFENFTIRDENLFISIVGTYEKEKIGQSCYHNNLSILENILSHSNDRGAYFVVDMVAGIDAFANTLHSQFDALVLVVEPTTKSVEVFRQYRDLAEAAGVYDQVLIVGNKVRDKKDEEFILKNIDKDKFVGCIGESDHIRDVDRGEEDLDFNKLEERYQAVLVNLLERSLRIKRDDQVRLSHLHDLHRKYVSQGYVKDRFGDLINQIDEEFRYE